VVIRGLLARAEVALLARTRRVQPVRPARALRVQVPGGSSSALFDTRANASHTGIRGFTHQSPYAGDLIFDAPTHQPLPSDLRLNFGFTRLGLLGVRVPLLSGIDEAVLSATSLADLPSSHAQDALVG
jgi:hypothetical protein